MLATAAAVLPAGQAWSYEVKWDGYRALAVKDGPRVQLLSRNQKNLTQGAAVATCFEKPAGRGLRFRLAIAQIRDAGRSRAAVS